MLSIGINRGCFLPSEILLNVISKALYWQQEDHCYRLFNLLSYDLRLRKPLKLKYLKNLIDSCLDAITNYLSTSSSTMIPAVTLALQYIICVFHKDIALHCIEKESKEEGSKYLVEKIKWSTFEHTIQLLFELVQHPLSDCYGRRNLHHLNQADFHLLKQEHGSWIVCQFLHLQWWYHCSSV